MSDGTGLAEALLGLDGFRVLAVVGDADELVITIETTVEVDGLSGRAGAGPRPRIEAGRDPGSGRASVARPGWCGASAGGVAAKPTVTTKTWTETSQHVDAQAVLTRRAGVEACRQVGA